MQKVKTFFHIFSNSLLPQAPYYHKLVKIPFIFSIKYFLTLVFFLNTIFAVFFLLKLQSLGIIPLKNAIVNSLEQFPNELTITVNNGFLQTTYGRPYLLWVDVNRQKRLFAVVDEASTPEKIKEYKSRFLFTAHSAVIKTADGYKVFPYNNQSFTVNKQTVNQAKSDFDRWFSFVSTLALFGFVFIAPILFSLLYFAYFFIIGFLAFILFDVFSTRKIKLGKTFQLSLHAATLPVVIDYTLCLFRPELARSLTLHLAFFVTSFVFVASAVYEAYLDPVTRVHKHHS